MKSCCLCLIFLFTTLKLTRAITSDEIRQWVDGHNSRRLKVAKGEASGQPGASEMNALIWDNELYAKAQAYAATRPGINHNPDRTVPSGRFRTGENLYSGWGSNPNFKVTPDQAMEAWFSEYVNYEYGPIRKSDFDRKGKDQIGHYTQMVWSNTLYVGCGTFETYDGQRKYVYIVCNYGPAGNIIGQTPYKSGGPVNQLTCGCGSNCNNCQDMYGGSR